MTQRLPTAVARKDFANVLRDSAAGERIKLTRYNKTVAVIIPKKDLSDLEDCQRLHGSGAAAEQAQTDDKPGDKPARAHASKAHAKTPKTSEK
jgi:antitoxin (DNA-binding transcriptional repressor) of toxin-antitoxin stability system